MMGSDDAGLRDAEAPEGANGDPSSSPLQLLEKEVPSSKNHREHRTDTESSLLTELQRRCDKIIELEVLLDQERERANRLERERTEEDEALSGELRDIMATVNVGSAINSTAAPPLPPPPICSIDGTATAGDLPFDSAAAAQQQTSGAKSKRETVGGTQQAHGGGSASALLSASGMFSEWRLGRVRGGRNEHGSGETGGGEAGSATEAALTKEGQKPEEEGDDEGEEENKGSVEGLAGGSERAVRKGDRREQAAGALRARVVELELQRAEATELMREKMDRSVRLEVQVEQLKNVVQSLSHASQPDETHRGWGEEGSKAAAGTTNTSAASDLDSLLRDVPGIDPSVLLLLHRSPWADGVIEGVRKKETCFEWQGRNTRGQWSSKPSVFPTELSSLPHHPAGLPLEPPLPPLSSSSPFPAERNASFPFRNSSRRSHSPTSGLAEPGVVEPKRGGDVLRGRQAEAEAGAEAGGSGLREKIGGAVAALGAVGRGLGGGGGGHTGGRLVTDEGVTLSFDLDKVGLPSDHWEWVGGWMVDSETEASSDQDGWIYGCSASEISEIALGRTFSRTGSGSTHSLSSPSATASTPSGGGSRSSAASAVLSPTSAQALKQQQQQQQQQFQHRSDVVPGEGTSGDAEFEGPRRREDEKTGGEVGAETSGGGGGGGGDGAGRNREPRLRRRRLVRVRMVARVDGGRESTTRVLELIRRLSSLEVLVRKLSRQVVTQQRQVTSLENQVAFLAPLQPKLRMVCALGKKDRMRGDALQRRLIEAENELKVLRRCMGPAGGTSGNPSSRAGPPPPPPPPLTAPADRRATPAPPRTATLISQTGKNSPGGFVWAPQAGGGGTDVPGSPDGSAAGVGSTAAWGWVGDVAQRAAGTLTRRPRAAPGEEGPAERGVAGEPIDIFSFEAGGGDSGTPV